MQATATGHWKKGLDGLPDRELFGLEEQVREVTQLPGWERLVAWIAAGHAAVLKSLTQGATKNHADQSRHIGYLAGLEEAPNIVQAIFDAASRRRKKIETKEGRVADPPQEDRPR